MAMKNIYEVLRSKEMDLVRLRTEVDALRVVAPLLSDRMEEATDTVWTPELSKNKWPLKVGHPSPTYTDS